MAKRKARYKVTTISHKNLRESKTSMGLAIIALIINFLFFPGLGSLIGGKIKAGLWQMILFLIGAIGTTYVYYQTSNYYSYTLFGIIVLISWIWGIVTGAKMIQTARY